MPWRLVAGVDVAGWESVAPTLLFEDGQVSGSSGCNRFSTTYTVNGDALKIAPPAATMMACGEPATSVERAYLAALEKVARWQRRDEVLTLLDDGGGELLRFEAASPAGTWNATSFLQGTGVSTLIAGTAIAATFASDGTLTGSAGCNTYRANYTAERGRLTISPPSSTKRFCSEPDGVMEQEQAYLAALPKAAAYSVEGTTLSLLTSAGTFVAVFERSAS